MRTFMLMSFTLASSLAVASASSIPVFRREVSPDMTCGSTGAGTAGYTCETGMCCSQYGYCGNTTDYCSSSNGCQAAFGDACIDDGSDDGDASSGDGRCGASFGNAVCASNECCSVEGYCGTTVAHCEAPDCQFNYGPACDANKIPSGSNTTTLSRSKVGSVAYGGAGIYSCAKEGTVALTYDDGPSNYTSDLLDLLAKYNAKATFFITGNNNGKGEIDNTSLPWPAVIQRQHSDGHQIASHTWSHPDLSNITSLQRKNEMIKNEMALRNILGFIPTYMRPPYSSCTAESGCESDLSDLGYHIIYFDLDTQDYLNDSPDLIQNSKNIVDNFFAGHSSSSFDALSITHDIHYQTVYNLTEYMLKELQSLNYTTVTVGECLDDPAENWYRIDSSTSLISSVSSATATPTSSSTAVSSVVAVASVSSSSTAASSTLSSIVTRVLSSTSSTSTSTIRSSTSTSSTNTVRSSTTTARSSTSTSTARSSTTTVHSTTTTSKSPSTTSTAPTSTSTSNSSSSSSGWLSSFMNWWNGLFGRN